MERLDTGSTQVGEKTGLRFFADEVIDLIVPLVVSPNVLGMAYSPSHQRPEPLAKEFAAANEHTTTSPTPWFSGPWFTKIPSYVRAPPDSGPFPRAPRPGALGGAQQRASDAEVAPNLGYALG